MTKPDHELLDKITAEAEHAERPETHPSPANALATMSRQRAH
jgi:hypothetical protein